MFSCRSIFRSLDLANIVSHRKTGCKKFVKKVKSNLKQHPLSEVESEPDRQALRSQFGTLARTSITYGSSFFYGITLKGFNALIAVNATGIHVIIKPNSPHSELRFSCSFDCCTIKLNDKERAPQNVEFQTHGQQSFTVTALPNAKNSFPPVTLFSMHSKLIVSLVNALANRKSTKDASGLANQREVNLSLSPLSVRSNRSARTNDSVMPF